MRSTVKWIWCGIVWNVLLAGTAIALGDPEFADHKYPTDKWVSLFNGKDLDGWTPKIRYCDLGDNFENTFRVEDGLLKVRYEGEGYREFGERFGHLFFRDSFSNYRFRVE
ncbi:MAG: family 16 glycoside hydrolase, partial [Planctomycetaceae bacterium]